MCELVLLSTHLNLISIMIMGVTDITKLVFVDLTSHFQHYDFQDLIPKHIELGGYAWAMVSGPVVIGQKSRLTIPKEEALQ